MRGIENQTSVSSVEIPTIVWYNNISVSVCICSLQSVPKAKGTLDLGMAQPKTMGAEDMSLFSVA